MESVHVFSPKDAWFFVIYFTTTHFICLPCYKIYVSPPAFLYRITHSHSLFFLYIRITVHIYQILLIIMLEKEFFFFSTSFCALSAVLCFCFVCECERLSFLSSFYFTSCHSMHIYTSELANSQSFLSYSVYGSFLVGCGNKGEKTLLNKK